MPLKWIHLILLASFARGLCANDHSNHEYYLAHGGIGYLVLEDSHSSHPTVLDTSLYHINVPTTTTAERDGNSLRQINTTYFGEATDGFPELNTSSTSTKHFERDPGTRDYRLVRETYSWRDSDKPGTEYPNRPIYLHRVKSSRAIDYFTSAAELATNLDTKVTTDALVAHTRELLAEEPWDLYYYFLHLDALVRAEKFDKLAELVTLWDDDFMAHGDESVLEQYARIKDAVRWHELESAGKNGDTIREKIVSRGTDLKSRLELLPTILNYERGLGRPYTIADELKPERKLSFLEQQVFVKVVRIVAMFRLLEGKREDALRLLAGCYRMGQLMNAEVEAHVRMIGSVFRMIALSGLEQFVLNACETKAEVQRAWEQIEELWRVDNLPDWRAQKVQDQAGPEGGFGSDWEIREKLADARMALLRAATAAQMRLVTDGALPKNLSEFAPLPSQGLPTDPFTSKPLNVKFSDPLLIYSMGPDEKDDAGAFAYDPTNGTVSSGDILSTMGRQRTYPYPRDGVKANTRADVLKLFPNGLPPDPFNDRKANGPRITNTTPVMVYSVGPDTDESRIRAIENTYVPKVQYDPTNGTVSAGELILTLPQP